MSERIKYNSVQKVLLEEKELLQSQINAINTEKARYGNICVWGRVCMCGCVGCGCVCVGVWDVGVCVGGCRCVGCGCVFIIFAG